MGTEIALSIDEMDICWSKNHMGIDHGALFQTDDRGRTKSDQVNYDNFDPEDDTRLAAMEMGFSKALREVMPRLELMGFTLETAQNEYESRAAESDETRKYLDEEGTGTIVPCMPFEKFLNMVKTTDIESLDKAFDDDCLDKRASEYGTKFITEAALSAVPNFDEHEAQVYSEQSLYSEILDFLHPYSALRLFAENNNNLDQLVKWQYGPLVDAGWEVESSFRPGARRRQKYIIITEGHTDAMIIELAIRTLRPEIHDFFSFIDMKDGYPFGGIGNLQKFAKGLTKMDVQNRTLLLYDNDAAGLSAYKKTSELDFSANMGVAMLPSLKEFEDFPTQGPTGNAEMDINGRAVAIECYLDFEHAKLPNSAIVQWSSYQADVSQYQGALASKGKYTDDFLKMTPESLIASNYNLSKLKAEVATIVNECRKIAVKCYECT